ncbi:hypothetical protein QNH48_19335 [Neobacillus sp. YX16]|uniref:hypothetical protein n=1 Tax=Neobacillus sp. YX16 TaxID=3047874 RepID=UPI0024C3C7D9|nr:hypothetical protein [Neobacillus sp. YX16]WHZ01157.1 hypothetical protein QNH48_19335 [Neobacillus sp. YX16]
MLVTLTLQDIITKMSSKLQTQVTWSDWYLENGLIQTPLDLEKVVDKELYNEALKLIEEQ